MGVRRKGRKKGVPITDGDFASPSQSSSSKPPSRAASKPRSKGGRSAPQSTAPSPPSPRSPSPTLNLVNAEPGPSRLANSRSKDSTPLAQVAAPARKSTSAKGKMRAPDVAGFNEEADFISFDAVSPSESADGVTDSRTTRPNGNEPRADRKPSRSPSPPRRERRRGGDHSRSRSPSRRKRRSPDVEPENPRKRDPSPPQRPTGYAREWDRGKRARSPEPRMRYDASDGRLDSGKAPWADGIGWDKCNNVAEMLHTEVEAFVKWVSPTPVEDEIRGLIVQQVTAAVCKGFPDASVLPFGSFATKLYLPLGDIDLVILSDSMAYSSKDTVLQSLAHVLKRAGITDRVTIVAKAKVPIVKFTSTHGRFNVDISVNQGNGVVSGQIINGFLRDMHAGGIALRALVLIAKAFLSQRSMNEVYTGGLGSYSIVCLAVSFLQMHPKIRRGEIDAEKNLGVLVMEFFELYGYYFNYAEVGISVRDGGTYFNKRERGWVNFSRNNFPMLSIEDPVETTNDISSGSYSFHRVRQSLAGAYNILRSTACQRADWLRARREGSLHTLASDSPEKMSILWKVMGITQETVNHRRLIEELYQSRTLHRVLGVQPKVAVVEMTSADGRLKAEPPRAASKPDSRHARSVQAAWEEADKAGYGDDEDEDIHRRSRKSATRGSDDDEEDEGRYRIGRDPPRKRRRTGGEHDQHTVYFVDDDDGSSMNEALAYASDSSSDDAALPPQAMPSRNGKPNSGAKRSYWLSKAMEVGKGSDGSLSG
ncbi:hypothetical protein HGRIS_012700 [Hohenbuehelia grisea]|uniref:polynucleotide adenylyltransferase n=1 Tax=Hohenbuehelia grisea TaxID=104357 RepID=A0ABR3IT93_9AGAR